jgi:hypothetical protein
MKLSLSISRKDGRPNFSSVGATAAIELELPDDVAKNPEMFAAQSRIGYALLESALESELAHLKKRDRSGDASEPPPEERRRDDRDRRDDDDLAEYRDPEPQSRRPEAPRNGNGNGHYSGGGGRNGKDDTPRAGNQFIAWAHKTGESDPDRLEELTGERDGKAAIKAAGAAGKALDLPSRIVDWDGRMIQDVFDELRHRARGKQRSGRGWN